MVKKFAVLQKIENDHKITQDTDALFLYHLQNCLLLALKEQGILSCVQYKLAQERLSHPHGNRAGNQMLQEDS